MGACKELGGNGHGEERSQQSMVLANQVNKVFLEGVIRHVKCCSSREKRIEDRILY